MLAAVGAVLGLALAHVGVELVGWLRPAHLPRQSAIAVTSEVALFVGLLTAVVGVGFGLMPALRSASPDQDPLRAGRTSVQRAGAGRVQRTMVIAEVALSVVPLVAAGLMLRTFVNLANAPIGFATDSIVTGKIAVSYRSFPEVEDRWRLHRDAIERVRQIPGVLDVSAGGPLPFDVWRQTRTYGRPEDETLVARATAQSVLPGYLRLTGARIVAGRDFTFEDIDHRHDVVIVDERIARQLWPEGAVGRRLALSRGRSTMLLEVIGVTEDVRVTRVRDGSMPNVILPYHLFAIEQALVIRTSQPADVIGPMVKRAVESLGTRRSVYDIRPMQAYVDASIGDTRFLTLVLTGFALAAILLAAIGLYGTLSYLTSQQTQEFAIRQALGASGWRVLREVAGEGFVLVTIGSVLGFAAALAATGALESLLYGVTPFDGATLVAVAAAVALAALVAVSQPAWRAARVEPASALRSE